MKSSKVNFYLRKFFILTGIFGLLMVVTSCEPEEPKPVEDPIATFQLEVSETNPRQVTFTNFSLNAATFLWKFGDGNTSTVKDPVHTFETFGTYEVVLTAFNVEGDTATFSQTIELKDPDAALALLAGTTSKTWRLYRVGTSLGVGPDLTNPRGWWSLTNNGTRPCKYLQEFTFHRDGRFVFNDMGSMWGEDGVFPTAQVGTCFAATAANMVNAAGLDVSAWLSGTHSFEYNRLENRITLNGLGAWIGLVDLGTTGPVTVPQQSVSFTATIEQRTGYDLMTVIFQYSGLVWSISYASYSNPALEPAVVLAQEPVVDLPLRAPAALFNTFASTAAADVQYLIPSDPDSDVYFAIGVEDPANPAAPRVGRYARGTAQFADLKFPTGFNIDFEGYTSFSIDVYVPSTNVFAAGGLTRGIMVAIADRSMTQNFWENWVQYVVPAENVLLDQWQTWTFRLDTPSAGSTGNPLTRDDLDTIILSIGGSNHTQDGTFFIRNFRFVK